MNEIFEKELQLIQQPVIEVIKEKLTIDFKNRNGKYVVKVENVSLLNLSIDEKSSELRECIVINSIYAIARVWVKFSEDGETSDNLNLMTHNKFSLLFNFETKSYYIDDSDKVTLINR